MTVARPKHDQLRFESELQNPLGAAFAIGVVNVRDQITNRQCLSQVFGFHPARVDRKAAL